VARQAKPKYPVNKRAVDAIRRGQARKGWDDVQLAEAVGTSKQAIGQVLNFKTQLSELLADMLRAVGEPDYLAHDLPEDEIELLEALRRAKKKLPREQADKLRRRFVRDIDGEIALSERDQTEK
jgi:hypothetical protein